MDNLEQQKLFYSIRSLLPYPAASQRSNYFDPVRDAPNEARKRRRTSDCPRETSVDSDEILTVNLSTPANIQEQAALNEETTESTPFLQGEFL
jgi:hypothetical protein